MYVCGYAMPILSYSLGGHRLVLWQCLVESADCISNAACSAGLNVATSLQRFRIFRLIALERLF